MKDFSLFKENKYGTKFYYNEKHEYHRLIGPAVEWKDGDKNYYINGIEYMYYYNKYNILFIFPELLEFISEYEEYIKQNIKAELRSKKLNLQIKIYNFTKAQINELPNWLKDLIIL